VTVSGEFVTVTCDGVVMSLSPGSVSFTPLPSNSQLCLNFAQSQVGKRTEISDFYVKRLNDCCLIVMQKPRWFNAC